MTKICITCNKELSLDSFYQSKSNGYNHIMSYCKECQKEYRKSRYKTKTREIELSYSKEYHANNLEIINKKARKRWKETYEIKKERL